MTHQEEIELVLRVQKGDPSSFAEFYSATVRMVWSKVWRMFQHREDAEEVVQDTFMKAFSRINSFHMDSRLLTWLGKIAFNTAISVKRNWKKQSELEIPCSADNLEHFADLLFNPRAKEIEKLDSGIIEALNSISPKHRAVIIVCGLQGKTHKEAALILGVRDRTIKSTLNRARVALRSKLKRTR